MVDYYKILGVSSQADEKEIKAAYRKLAKKYHPDAVADNLGLTEKMYEIQEAYDVLGDNGKRKKYEECLRKNRNKDGQKKKAAESRRTDPDPSQFERFFGFQPGKGMESYQERNSGGKKSGGPIEPGDFFAAYFGKKKQ